MERMMGGVQPVKMKGRYGTLPRNCSFWGGCEGQLKKEIKIVTQLY